MTESKEVAVRQASRSLEPAWVTAEREHYRYLLGLGKAMFDSGLMPKSVQSPQQAAIIMLTGRDYGLTPMQSIKGIDVIEGRPRMESELMVAIVRREKAGTFSYEQGEGYCEITATRADSGESFSVRWDRERVARAGINKKKDGGIKKNWRAHEQEMLRHRCESEVCRALFPDLYAAVYTPDELPREEPAQPVEPPTSRTEAIKEALGVKALPEAEPEPATEPQPEEAESATEPETEAEFLVQLVLDAQQRCEGPWVTVAKVVTQGAAEYFAWQHQVSQIVYCDCQGDALRDDLDPCEHHEAIIAALEAQNEPT